MKRNQFIAICFLMVFAISTFSAMFPLYLGTKINHLKNSPNSDNSGLPENQKPVPDTGINIQTDDIDLTDYNLTGNGNSISVKEHVSNSSSGDIAIFYNVRSDGFIDYSMISSYDATGLAINTNFLSNDVDERRFSDINDLFPLPHSTNQFGAGRKAGRFQNIWTPWKSNNWYNGIDVFERTESGGEFEHLTFYSAFIINSSTTRVVTMLVGSDDEIWVFKDGQSILNSTTPRSLQKDDDSIPITLHPGPNAFLIKVHDDTGDTGWCARFNQSGSAVTTGIKEGLTKSDKIKVTIPSGWIDMIGQSHITISNLKETGNWIYELSPSTWSVDSGGDLTDISKGTSTDNYYTSTNDGTTSVSFTFQG
ncbi:MAG: hypothetical protein ACTSWG_05540, partial [Candidatus Helarchaeota archaeon]